MNLSWIDPSKLNFAFSPLFPNQKKKFFVLSFSSIGIAVNSRDITCSLKLIKKKKIKKHFSWFSSSELKEDDVLTFSKTIFRVQTTLQINYVLGKLFRSTNKLFSTSQISKLAYFTWVRLKRNQLQSCLVPCGTYFMHTYLFCETKDLTNFCHLVYVHLSGQILPTF